MRAFKGSLLEPRAIIKRSLEEQYNQTNSWKRFLSRDPSKEKTKELLRFSRNCYQITIY